LLFDGLNAIPDVEAPEGDGAMYAFFRVRGREDDMVLAKGLVADAGLGLAPGSAFGPEGAGWLRWCFASRPERVADGLERLRSYLEGHK
jgi:aspartate aminotransferase